MSSSTVIFIPSYNFSKIFPPTILLNQLSENHHDVFIYNGKIPFTCRQVIHEQHNYALILYFNWNRLCHTFWCHHGPRVGFRENVKTVCLLLYLSWCVGAEPSSEVVFFAVNNWISFLKVLKLCIKLLPLQRHVNFV